MCYANRYDRGRPARLSTRIAAAVGPVDDCAWGAAPAARRRPAYTRHRIAQAIVIAHMHITGDPQTSRRGLAPVMEHLDSDSQRRGELTKLGRRLLSSFHTAAPRYTGWRGETPPQTLRDSGKRSGG